MGSKRGVIVWILAAAGLAGLFKLSMTIWTHERTDARVVVELAPGVVMTYNVRGDVDDLAPPGSEFTHLEFNDADRHERIHLILSPDYRTRIERLRH